MGKAGNGAKGLTSLSGAPSFKAGGALPSISDDLPPVGGGPGAKKNKTPAGAVKFNDQFDDDFSAGEDDEDENEIESPNEAKNDDEEDEDDGDFDANELLNLGDY